MKTIDFLLGRQEEKQEKTVILNGENEVIEFTIRPLTNDEYSRINKKSKKINPRTKEIIIDEYVLSAELCATAVVNPDFKNADIISKIPKATTGADVVNALLKPGEISLLAQEILNHSGFQTNINEEIEEIKK